MRKRLLIGLLTMGMVLQSVSVPVLAAPSDAAMAEAESGEMEDDKSGAAEEGKPDGADESKPGEGTEEKPDGADESKPGEGTEEKPEGSGESKPGEGTEEKPDGADESKPGEGTEEEPDGTGETKPGESTGEESDESSEDMAEEPGESDEMPEEEQQSISANQLSVLGEGQEELLTEYVSGGLYQEGSFDVVVEQSEQEGSLITPMADAAGIAEAEEYIYQQLLAKKASIDVSKYQIPKSEIGAIVFGVINDHPDLYFASSGFNYSSYTNGIVASVMPIYIDGLDDAAFQSGLNAALASVDSGMTDIEKAIALHDYLAVNCEYDYENYLSGSMPQTSFSAYGALVNRTAVCQGYALAYKLLLNKAGIKSYMVTSDEMNHAWNLIELGGKYYQVDVTWDDPTRDRIGRVSHAYMFCSDTAFGNHHDWQVTSGSEKVGYTAVDASYDSAFWKASNSPLVILGNDCYYIYSSGRNIRKASLDNVTSLGTKVVDIAQWYSWDGTSIWSGTYSGLFCVDDRLYYNDPTMIYSIALDGTDKRIEFKANLAIGYIYGSAFCQGKVLYCLHQSPELTEKETVLTAHLSGGVGEPDIPIPGENEGALNLDNFSAEYTTTDGKKINSAANGRPKLLIFYSNLCGNSKNTIRDISRNIGDYAGVDVYAIETNKGTKESVEEFKKNYGCSTIAFSYDTGDGNSASMWKYVYAAGLGSPVSWPVICYIDANNRLQYVTSGYQASDVVLDNLKDYCGYAGGVSIIDLSAANITLKNTVFTYSGVQHEPKAVVLVSGRALVEGEDYTLSYLNNRNAGTATVIVEGVYPNCGTVSRTFEIKPAQVVIRAKDKSILIGDEIPKEYEYEVSGLVTGETLQTEPSVSCAITSTAMAGQYDIIAEGADAGANYIITYEKGRLSVASEYVSCTVMFDVQGHGKAPEKVIDVKVGSVVARPEDPVAEGYRFDGWYRDAACTKVWNFESDIVQSDMTLYAKWLAENMDSGFALQEISDVYYTGNACKPAISVYDGETLLKAGRDYQIKYYNNTNTNRDGMRKEGDGKNEHFHAELPYVEIIGKGDYTEVVKVNFNILKASIGGGSDNPAAGVTLKVSDQLVTAKKVQKPFSSIKYVKGMKRDTDFTVTLQAVNARDQFGASLPVGYTLDKAEIPAGYEGEFRLTVQGIGNYEGSICKPVYVTDKTHLIKNATITIGKNLKNITFTGEPVQLKPAEVNSADTFTVKYGKTFLKPGRDYTVSYLDKSNERVGKATLVITGMGEYVGSKTATFNIKGKPFNARMVKVDGLSNKVYTGKALTQNTANLIYAEGTEEEKDLIYGTDYTITYAKNINKGSATMTFKGVERAGYSGSFKKTFKITAADITDTEQVNRAAAMSNMAFPYCKAGVKPVDEILLTNSAGFVLRNGKDYTLKYKNNKAVAGVSAEKPPTVTVQGKGNYAGKFDVTFQITTSDLKHAVDDGSIEIRTSAVAYNPKKAETYEYKPAVKLMDGKSTLRAGTDYEITYLNNTQTDYESYIQKLKDKSENAGSESGNEGSEDEESVSEAEFPRAVITEKEGSNYRLDGQIVVLLPIYEEKLTKSKLKVTVGDAIYTGGQIIPAVSVYYLDESGEILLVEGVDYTLSYGANVKSGKNKGSVKISGIAPRYGGDVTVKFNIDRKAITY